MMMIKLRSNVFIIAIVVVFILFCNSCDKKWITFNIDCNECYTNKPDSSDLILEFSEEYIGSEGIQFILYEGDVENNNIIKIDTSYTGKFYFYTQVNKNYSVRSNYKTKDNKTYSVINGTKLKTKYVEDVCDNNCWVIVNDEIDLKVSYPEYFK